MGTARKVLSNTITQFVGQGISSVISAISIIVLTRYLGPSIYGQYTFIYEFLAFFSIVADFGLFTISVREMSKDESKRPLILGNILGLRSTLLVITTTLAIAAIFFFPRISGVENGGFVPIGVAIASLTAILTLLNGTINSIFQVHLKMHIAAFTQVIFNISRIVIILLLVYVLYPDDPEKAFYYLIWAGVIGTLFMISTSFIYARKLAPIKPRFDFDFWKEIIKKTLPFGLAIIIHTFYLRLDYLMLSGFKGPEEVGLYSLGMKILELLSVLPLFFMNAVLPSLTRHIKEKSEKFKEIIQLSFNFLSMIGVPILIGGFVMSYQVISLVAKEEFLTNLEIGYYGSDMAMKILVFAAFFTFLNQLFSYALVAAEKQTKILWVNIASLVFKIALQLVLVPMYGFRGAAFSSVFAAAFMFAGYYYFYYKALRFSPKLTPFLKIFASGVIMGAVVYVLREPLSGMIGKIGIILTMGIGAITYAIALFATKSLSKELVKTVLKK